MKKSLSVKIVLLLSFFLIIGSSCKKSVGNPIEEDDPIENMEGQNIEPEIAMTCVDLSNISDSFFMEDPSPKDQAVGCGRMAYPDWKTSLYVLPYPVSTGYKVKLNNCSSSYHGKDQPDALATDFDMPIGTCITAARAGKVIHVVESGKDGSRPNNLVVIEHLDKTYAQYMHLTKDGAAVKVGDEVTQGQFIGLSGSTGLAGYPHLHFIVTKSNWEYPYVGVPVNFKNTFANERGLKSNRTYFAFSYE